MVPGPRKNQLDFGGNLDHVTLGLGLVRVEFLGLWLTFHVMPVTTVLTVS